MNELLITWGKKGFLSIDRNSEENKWRFICTYWKTIFKELIALDK